ncbi:MAG: tetratricopeptide repeat protein [Bacteroidia bacterium]|nr:tetratricopeptide repeat protein [Bacteroidia bacterium]
MKSRLYLYLFLVVFQGKVFAREKIIDSLKLALKNARHDTTRCSILNAMIEAEGDDRIWTVYNDQLKQLAKKNSLAAPTSRLKFFYLKHFADALNNTGFIYGSRGNNLMAIKYYNQSLKIQKEIGDKNGIANALNNLGGVYYKQSDNIKSIEYYSKSLKIQEEIGDKKGIATSLSNIGIIYENQGHIAKAIEYYSKSLKIKEEIGDKKGIATSLNNLGLIYDSQGESAKAIEYYGKSLKIREGIDDKKGVAASLNNLGVIYKNRGEIAKAIEYYSKSLRISQEIGDKTGIATCYNNLGVIYSHQGDPSCFMSKEECLGSGISKAIENYSKSLKIREEIGDKNGIANSLNNMGSIYIKKKNYVVALEFCARSLTISKKIGHPQMIRNAAEQLKTIHQKLNQPKKALEMFELFIQMRDSISNQETKKTSIKTQLKYEYEKKSAADSVKNAEEQKVKDAQLSAQTATLKQEKFQRYSLVVGLLLVVLGLLFVINRFRITQKQKKIIEEQKLIVDDAFEKLHEKNKEVMDSIYYARRIQRALITSEKYIERKLKIIKAEL